MFLNGDKEIVVTIAKQSGKYVKLTIENSSEAIANLMISSGNHLIRIFDRFQDELLIEYGKDISVNIERVIDSEKKLMEVSKKMSNIENGESKRELKIYNFWFADEYNNLEVFKNTVENTGFNIDTSTWEDCV